MLFIKRFFFLLQAFLFIISSFSVYNSKFKLTVDRGAMNLTSIKDFGFEPITSEKLKVSDEEKEKCRSWYEDNILNPKDTFPFDFTVGGKKLSRNLQDWDISVGDESEAGGYHKGGKTVFITLNHKNSSLCATAEATIYEENATCEWTVYIENTGDKDSPVIKDFYGADCLIETGISDLYVSRGSRPDADDFELLKSTVSPTPMIFNGAGGRGGSFLPYFNLSGKECGAVVAVGWTGQWYASLNQILSGVRVKAKQEFFNTYLEAGEKIRSPLTSVTFYDGDNALKGFNSFRNWEKDCVYPDSIRPINGYVIANEFSTKNTQELIGEVEKVNPEVLESTDYFWMDAGWYKYNEGWYDGVGNWIPDPDRFPDGLKPLSDAMAQRGKKYLLWYEPERVRENTVLYNEGMSHEGWIIEDGDNLLWNMGNDDACDFISAYIAKSMTDNGVSMYRQDFNFDVLSYWEKADKEFMNGRTGITENHYVTNLYRYLDTLIDTVDGLIIDNCASGGKRLDIEMTRRSIPLWRSDYNCGNADGSVKEDVLEATQAMTYGLSFWLPYSGTNRYFHSEYASRSAILTCQSVYEPTPSEYNRYSDISGYMTKNYYPLNYGGLAEDKYLAMQFGDETEGAALIYKREKVRSDDFRLILNGLSKESDYEVRDFDNPESVSVISGEKLMTEGISISVSETPKCAIILYNQTK